MTDTITMIPPIIAKMLGFSPVNIYTQRGFNRGSTTVISMASRAVMYFSEFI